MQATAEVTAIREDSVRPSRGTSPGTLLVVAVCFGLVAGLGEGAGLLLFQKIDWRSWGLIVHVSSRILWISPLVDGMLFLAVALVLIFTSWKWPGVPAFRAAVLTFTALTLYDWLLVTHRLHHPACFLLAAGVGVVFSQWAASHESVLACFWRRTLPMLAVVVAVLLVVELGQSWWRERTALASLPVAAPGSPNVLMIAIDTLRADHVSAYGYLRLTTPSLDRLAKQGVLFENAVSASSWTFPAHVSLLTGKYPFEDGLGKVRPMPLWGGTTQIIRDPLIGEDLQQRGYRTGAFSGNRIYVVHNLGFGRGFIHFEDDYFSLGDALSRTVFGREFERWVLARGLVLRMLARLGVEFDWDSEGTISWRHPILDAHPPRKRGEEVNREVLKWIGNGPQAHPFFAFLNYFDVHAPYGGPLSRPEPWAREKRIDQYDDGVRYVDDCVGQLMAELARRHLDQNTVVVITADHGELLGEHNVYFHGKSLYWDLIHVPLIFWYPGHIPAGVRESNVVSTSSLPVTLSSWLPGHAHLSFPGSSLSDLWEGSQTDGARNPALSELAVNSYEFDRKDYPKYPVPSDLEGPIKSIVDGHWHLIMHKKFGGQLYDWSNDPHETHDLIHTSEGKEEAGLLTEQLLNLLAGRKAEKNELDNAASLNPNGDARGDFTRRVTEASHIDDYYILRAHAGSEIALEVQRPASQPAPALDSVLAVENSEGKILQTCRNPGDDHLPPPGTPDATPEAFDDMCVNVEDSPEAVSVSRLEIQVPGNAGTPVNLYVRVADWNGNQVAAGDSYTLSMSAPSAVPAANEPQAQRNLN